MKTVLITGAHGFLGRYCALEFSRNGFRVIGLGYGKWEGESPENFGIQRWIEAAVTLDSLQRITEPVNVIVHCAGSGSVGYSLTDPMQDFQRTVDTTLAVLEFMRLSASHATLVYPSSAAIYGCREAAPILESDPLQPVSPYGVHKKIAEELCFSYARSFGIQVSSIRFFSIYGNGLRKQLLWEACRRISNARQGEVAFFGAGTEMRDWLHAKDAAALVYAVGCAQTSGIVVNGGCGKSVAVRDVLTMIADGLGGMVAISFNGQVREGDPKHFYAHTSRAQGLDWQPRVTLSEGVSSYIAWFKKETD
ncbi:MAG: NAD-dependent epimerase/dehydratase family protein [Desulfuromonadaceae bacterium]